MRKTSVFLSLLAVFSAGFIPPAEAGEGREIIIEITGFEFVIAENFAPGPGDTVIFINRDLAPHTATALDKSWDSGRLSEGESWRLEITAETALDFSCRFHPNMKGTLEADQQ